MNTKKEKVMVFGVFDNLHEGHRFLLKNALNYGLELYIVVTPTHAVEKIKGKLPFYSIKERMHALEKEYPEARIIEGDNDAELWTPIINNTPEVVVCGYDQGELYDALSKISDKYKFELIQIKENLNGDELHSRYINKSV